MHTLTQQASTKMTSEQHCCCQQHIGKAYKPPQDHPSSVDTDSAVSTLSATALICMDWLEHTSWHKEQHACLVDTLEFAPHGLQHTGCVMASTSCLTQQQTHIQTSQTSTTHLPCYHEKCRPGDPVHTSDARPHSKPTYADYMPVAPPILTTLKRGVTHLAWPNADTRDGRLNADAPQTSHSCSGPRHSLSDTPKMVQAKWFTETKTHSHIAGALATSAGSKS
jgi:hypothetical protein